MSKLNFIIQTYFFSIEVHDTKVQPVTKYHVSTKVCITNYHTDTGLSITVCTIVYVTVFPVSTIASVMVSCQYKTTLSLSYLYKSACLSLSCQYKRKSL